MPIIPENFEIEDIGELYYFYPLVAIMYNTYVFIRKCIRK